MDSLDKLFNIYCSDEVPEATRIKYKKYLDNEGCFGFELGSEGDLYFGENWKRAHYVMIRKVTGKDIENYQFFWLFVKSFNYRNDEFQCVSEKPCTSKKNSRQFCPLSIKQTKKIILDDDISSFDIFEYQAWFGSLTEIIVNRKLYEILKVSDLTGFEFIPCLSPNKQYSDQEKLVDYDSDDLESDAVYFQMKITGKPKKPVRFDGYMKKKAACDDCGLVEQWEYKSDMHNFSRTELYFKKDFEDYDFQSIREWEALDGENCTEIDIRTICSNKAIQLFTDHKIKGFYQEHKSKPSIKFEVVNTVEENENNLNPIVIR